MGRSDCFCVCGIGGLNGGKSLSSYLTMPHERFAFPLNDDSRTYLLFHSNGD